MNKKVFNENKWDNIDHEVYRTYVFPNNNHVTIQYPIKIYISKNGHRILDFDNISHYIPNGWIHLYWETTDDIAFRF